VIGTIGFRSIGFVENLVLRPPKAVTVTITPRWSAIGLIWSIVMIARRQAWEALDDAPAVAAS
jgi:hypothetical protein